MPEFLVDDFDFSDGGFLEDLAAFFVVELDHVQYLLVEDFAGKDKGDSGWIGHHGFRRDFPDAVFERDDLIRSIVAFSGIAGRLGIVEVAVGELSPIVESVVSPGVILQGGNEVVDVLVSGSRSDEDQYDVDFTEFCLDVVQGSQFLVGFVSVFSKSGHLDDQFCLVDVVFSVFLVDVFFSVAVKALDLVDFLPGFLFREGPFPSWRHPESRGGWRWGLWR